MKSISKISSGIEGLDEILDGGFVPQQSYLIQGGPGTGKSTLGYHFLNKGINQGESTLYISFGESSDNIKGNARNIGIDLERVHFLDLNHDGDLNDSFEPYSIFPVAEVENESIFTSIKNAVEKYKPKRVLLDSITMFQFLNHDPYQTRKLALSFIRYICRKGATLLMTSELSEKSTKEEATFWVDGIVNLKYSDSWRKISIQKYRGSDFRVGNHALKITGTLEATNIHASYLADNIIFLRYLEMDGELHKAIGVLKKRLSDFERSIRRFEITKNGIEVGKKLSGLRGILSGTPETNRVN
ncbi:MAG: ATPase domain-containing protein [Balneolaceae bacterium]